MSENNNVENNNDNIMHCCGICRKCKNICEDYERETIWEIIRNKVYNFFGVIFVDINNNILDPLSVWHDMKFNKVYRCFSCGMLLVPKFENNEKCKIVSFRQCGWWKIKNSYGGKRCMCHHCVEHRNSYTHEDDINEWNKYVTSKNTFLVNKIKKDNMKFYVKYVKDKNW